jgi:hypothetical protein
MWRSAGRGFELICRDDGELSESARSGMFHILPAESAAVSGSDALRLARVIVECEAGELQVSSDASTGTTFHLVFPSIAA